MVGLPRESRISRAWIDSMPYIWSPSSLGPRGHDRWRASRSCRFYEDAGFAGALLAAALVPLSSAAAVPGPNGPPPAGGEGPDRPSRAGRQAVEYREPYEKEKAELLATINASGQGPEAPPLAYTRAPPRRGPLLPRRGHRGSVGHWDLDGRPPYLRSPSSAASNAHAENFAPSRSSRGR